MTRRFADLRQLSLCFCLLGLTCGPLFVGCDDAEAVAVNKVDVDEVKIRLATLTDEVSKLPTGRPDQLVAHTRLKTKLNNCKIQFKSKHLARLGSVADSVFQQTRKEIEEIEGMIRSYPR